MLNGMLQELNRLITKYSGDAWNSKPTANRLVELLMEHAFFLQQEVNEVESGARRLRATDFLGPRTREARKSRRAQAQDTAEGGSNANERQETEDHHKRFNEIGQHLFWKKRRGVRKTRERRKTKMNV